MSYVVHAAKIPEFAQSWPPERRRLEKIQYVNACNDKKWYPAPEALFEPWTIKPCQTCMRIVSSQPGRSPQGASIRPRHQV